MTQQQERIIALKKEKNAIILAHYYQIPEIQAIADFLGDSLALAQATKNTDADVIVFCGVHFMAETAKILNPQKTVVLPNMGAGCSLADSADPAKFKKWKEENPDAVFITYINCSTEVKALSDIIVTSANAEKIVNSIPKDKKICFAPDKNLGTFIANKYNREMTMWNGGCHVHLRFSEEDVIAKKAEFPDAMVLAHPECPQHILKYADYIGSTTGIINKAGEVDKKDFIILTEPGVFYPLETNNPNKRFIPVFDKSGKINECEYMKKITLDTLEESLISLTPEINLDEELRLAALKPLEKMLELSK